MSESGDTKHPSLVAGATGKGFVVGASVDA